MIPNQRKCLECGLPIEGRADKKFCDDYCRSTYNNRLYQKVNPIVRRVNSRLRKNRRILAQMYSEGQKQVNKNDLIHAGFDFRFFTNSYAKDDRTFYFCYDQGYATLNEEEVALVRRN